MLQNSITLRKKKAENRRLVNSLVGRKTKIIFQNKKGVYTINGSCYKTEKFLDIRTSKTLLIRFGVNCRHLAVRPNEQFYTFTCQEKGGATAKNIPIKLILIKLSTFAAH